MRGGVTKLVALALDVAPITLKDIREVWTWKTETVIPLSQSLSIPGDPRLHDVGKSDFEICEDAELTLFSWAIYGELFDHVLRSD